MLCYTLRNDETSYETNILDFKHINKKTKLEIIKITLQINNLEIIPDYVICDCPNLEYFDCSCCSLIKLPNILFNLQNLEVLICKRNKLVNLNKLYTLKKLKHLNCSYNQLKELPITRDMSDLNILYCHHNPINEMPYDIVFMKNLRNYRRTKEYTYISELPDLINSKIEREYYKVHLKYYYYTYIHKFNVSSVLYY
jgi:Leucine-rich repeat (LRR) protein